MLLCRPRCATEPIARSALLRMERQPEQPERKCRLMGQSLDQILAQVVDRDIVNVTMVSNQDNGLASYAVGGLVFHMETGGVFPDRPGGLSPARLESSEPFTWFFSNSMRDIDPPSPPFGHSPRQPFNADATAKLGVSISLRTDAHVMQLEGVEGGLFPDGASKALVTLSPMENLLVGLGPSLGGSAASVFVVAFLGFIHPPLPPH
jgi:hypothetical protein